MRLAKKKSGDGGAMKILLIEDSKFQRMATERALVNAGYVVIQAGDGDEGLRMARENISLGQEAEHPEESS